MKLLIIIRHSLEDVTGLSGWMEGWRVEGMGEGGARVSVIVARAGNE